MATMWMAFSGMYIILHSRSSKKKTLLNHYRFVKKHFPIFTDQTRVLLAFSFFFWGGGEDIYVSDLCIDRKA